MAGGLQREWVPHALLPRSRKLDRSRKLNIAQVFWEKNVPEGKRNRPLQNSFDLNGKKEFSDE